jgi:hypothetical protein
MLLLALSLALMRQLVSCVVMCSHRFKWSLLVSLVLHVMSVTAVSALVSAAPNRRTRWCENDRRCVMLSCVFWGFGGGLLLALSLFLLVLISERFLVVLLL